MTKRPKKLSETPPPAKPYHLTPSEIELLRQDALEMNEVAKAYFAKKAAKASPKSSPPNSVSWWDDVETDAFERRLREIDDKA